MPPGKSGIPGTSGNGKKNRQREAKKRTVIPRSGAKRGDRIFVTGTLGDAGAGLELLKAGVRSQKAGVRSQKSEVRNKDFYCELIERHLRPVPRVEWGRKIALSGCASAMIDVSDGLSSDLYHICEESGRGAVLFSESIPFSEALLKTADRLRKTPLRYALTAGEDYELLFTVPPARIKTLAALHIPVTEIGMMTSGQEMFLMNAAGRKTALLPGGYDHFARTPSPC